MWKKAMEKRTILLATALTATVLAAAPISLTWSPTKTLSPSLDTASARIGHPLSPGSIAGVHRRVYRRNARRGYYGAGAVSAGLVGAAAAGAYYGSTPSYGTYNGSYYGSAPYHGGYRNLYSYSPGPYATGQETNANTHPVAADDELHAYCLSRTFNAGPC